MWAIPFGGVHAIRAAEGRALEVERELLSGRGGSAYAARDARR